MSIKHSYIVEMSYILYDECITMFMFYRIWDIDCGACLRLLEGHNDLVR